MKVSIRIHFLAIPAITEAGEKGKQHGLKGFIVLPSLKSVSCLLEALWQRDEHKFRFPSNGMTANLSFLHSSLISLVVGPANDG